VNKPILVRLAMVAVAVCAIIYDGLHNPAPGFLFGVGAVLLFGSVLPTRIVL
jgi:hypothetical protein